MNKITKNVIHWDDIWFSVEITIEEDEIGLTWFSFKAFEILSLDVQDFKNDKLYPRSWKNKSHVGNDRVLELENAKVFLTGSIRFDGCSDLEFLHPITHFCGLRNVKQLFTLIDRIYQEAAKVIPGAIKDNFK